MNRSNKKQSKRILIQSWLGFLKSNYLPRWIIFSIDCVLLILGYLFFMLLWREMGVGYLVSSRSLQYLTCFLGLYILSALIFRTFVGVIRYSNGKDTFRLLLMTLSASTVFFAIDLRFDVLEHTNFTSFLIIFLWGSFVFIILSLFRYIVRLLYFAWFIPNGEKKKRAIVLGSDLSSEMLVQSMKAESYGSFIPVAMLDFESNRKGQHLGDTPIVRFKNADVAAIFKKYDADTLVFFRNQIKFVRQNIADECLNNGIQLTMVSLFEPYSSAGKTISAQAHSISIEDLLGRDVIVLDDAVIKKQINDSTVLITGAGGSIGSEITRQVASYSCKNLILFDIAESPLHEIFLKIKDLYPDINTIPVIGDVQNLHDVETVFKQYRPEHVYHAAAYKHVPMMELFPRNAITVNILGTKNVADMACKYKATNFLMVSTDKAVNPTNVMGASKRIAEMYVQALFYSEKEKAKEDERAFHTRIITTRFGNVLGSNGSVVPLFKKQIAQGGPVTVTHKDIIRYFMTIPEACSLVLEAGCMGKGGEVFIFDMGEPVRIYDLARKMIQLAGLMPERDIQIIETGLRDGEKLYEELLTNKETSISTYNKKILIAKVQKVQYEKLSGSIDDLIETALAYQSDEEIVRKMKAIVPEYISQNSKYQALDTNELTNNN